MTSLAPVQNRAKRGSSKRQSSRPAAETGADVRTLESVEKLWAALSSLGEAMVDERAAAAEREQGMRAEVAQLRELVSTQAATIDKLNARIAAERDEDGAKIGAAVDSIKVVAERVEEVLVIAEKADETYASRLSDVTKQVTEHTGAIEQLGMQQVAARRALEDAQKRIDGSVDELSARCDQLAAAQESSDGIVADLAASNAAEFVQFGLRCEAIEGAAVAADRRDEVAAARLAERVEAVTAAAQRDAAAQEERIGGIAGGVEALVEQLAGVEARFQSADDRLTRQAEQAAAAAREQAQRGAEAVDQLGRRLQATVASLPKHVMIDGAGDLVAVDGSGGTTRIGRVVGKRGREGAGVRDARVEDGQLVLAMSDGRTIRAGQLQVQPVKQTRSEDEVLAGVAVRLKAEKLTQARICAVLRISRARLRRLLQDAATVTP